MGGRHRQHQFPILPSKSQYFVSIFKSGYFYNSLLDMDIFKAILINSDISSQPECLHFLDVFRDFLQSQDIRYEILHKMFFAVWIFF